MKISYNDLCQYLLKQATIEEISSRLFQLGHENEILGDIIDVDFTPNRGDCLSVRGLARDLGVFYKFNDKKKYYDKQIKKYNLNFTNNSPEDCPNISFLKIKIGDYTNSYEQYLEDYFKKFGINKNNLLTDISNYLAYEIGQPTHCYDLDKIDENIEFNKEILDCEFKTLLGKKISLTDTNCFFSSNGEIINLAGVVGSKNSSCSSGTSSVLLECAYFLPKSIIGKSLKYDIKSDAAHKFERGVDPLFQEEAIRRFIFIVSEHAEILDLEFVSFSNKNHAPVKLDLNSNVKNAIKRASLEFNNLEPQFSREGRLISRRCVSCHRRVKKIPINNNDWGGRQSRCASCLVNNKKPGVRQSTAAPIFNEWGSLISKVCSKCKERKPSIEFSKRDKGIGQTKSWCKACVVNFEKAWRSKKKKVKDLKTPEQIVKEQKGFK